MRKFKTWRDPYDVGYSPCGPREIEIQEGLTVLVGCNGAGKSTLLANIKEVLEGEEIPFIQFDNLSDGGSSSASKYMYEGNMNLAVQLLSSSEGENICHHFSSIVVQARHFVKTGQRNNGKKTMMDALVEAFGGEGHQEITSNERWILLDATDSGLSIDNVVDFKQIFNLMLEDANEFGVDLYIVISANEYELAAGEQCFDVMSGKYLTFEDYSDYKKFILDSRKRKDKKISSAEKRRNK